MTKFTISLAGVALVASCAAAPAIPAARFANAAVVTRVDDRRDVATRPAQREFVHALYHYDGFVQRRLTRALELPVAHRALGVNALDEVPDSTWFTNRIGVRELGIDELRTGPARQGSPEDHRPWTVHTTKSGGTEPGLMVSDARGVKFLLKFDQPGVPEQTTAAHVIVGKLLWACGYNVTEDHVVAFSPEDFVLAPDATVKEQFGAKHPMTRAELDAMLELATVGPDGRYRGLASLWLEGKPLGGPPAEGVRADDPNDRIAHELRRELRGAYAMFAWLDHVDVQESNFIDMWVEDGDRHYVKHYLLDFGKALGVMNTTARDARHGHEYGLDFAAMGWTLANAGTVKRSWEGRRPPGLRGVGLYDAKGFDPGSWKPGSPAFIPFLTADRFDNFWAAKIMIRLTRAQIRAVVASARLSDARSADYLTDVIVARQRATARYWFDRVNPLDRFAVAAQAAGVQVCFDDLAIAYQLTGEAAATAYRVTTYDVDARRYGPQAKVGAGDGGRTCTPPLALAAPFGGYTIVRLETERRELRGETFVHLARDPGTGQPRVIGIWRQ